MNTEPKLEPCPFCGEQPYDFEGDEVACINKQCFVRPRAYGKKDWNTRAQPQSSQVSPQVEPYQCVEYGGAMGSHIPSCASQVSWKPKTRDEWVTEISIAITYADFGQRLLKVIDAIYALAQKELREENERLRQSVNELLALTEADETGYVTDVGFVDADAIRARAAALATDRKDSNG